MRSQYDSTLGSILGLPATNLSTPTVRWGLWGLAAVLTACVSSTTTAPVSPASVAPAPVVLAQDDEMPKDWELAPVSVAPVDVTLSPNSGYRDPYFGQVVGDPAPPPPARNIKTVSSSGQTSGQTVPARAVTAGTPPTTPANPRAVAGAAPEPEDVASEDATVATINEAGQPEVAPVAGATNSGAAPGDASGGVYGAASAQGNPPATDVAPVTPGINEAPAQDLPVPEGDEFEDQDPSALTDFDPYLRDQGAWVEHPYYGTVWVPARSTVGPKFVPYVTNGHWSLTSEGDWVWVSDYNFGWVTFHYGRWIWTSDYAWVWIPGRTYAPAWVRFRTFGQPYIGWGPLPPTFIWRGGVAVAIGVSYPVPYVFCPYGYAFYPGVSTYIIWERYRVRELVRRSRPLPPHHHQGRGHRARVASPAVRDIPERARPAERVRPSANALALSRRGSAAKARTKPLPHYGGDGGAKRGPTLGAGIGNDARGNSAQFHRRPASTSPNRQGAEWPRNYQNRGRTVGTGPIPASAQQRTGGASAFTPRSNAPQNARTWDTRRAPETRRLGDSARRPQTPQIQTAPNSARPSAPRIAPSRERGVTPSRSPSPNRSVAPSRSSTPSRSVAPSRSAPTRNYSAPNRSAPSRGSAAPSRSSAPSRSAAPSRSSAPSRSASPSRGSSGSRSFGGGSSHRGGGGRRR